MKKNLTEEEKLKLQEKLGKKIKQYETLAEMVHDLGIETAELDNSKETVALRNAYNERKKEIAGMRAQIKTFALQAKAIKNEIDEIQEILIGPRRKNRRKTEEN